MNRASIRLLILDVDGVLTDGRLVTPAQGEAYKAYFVQDGFAIKLWQRLGGQVAILSGRNDGAVHRRAEELGIECLLTGVADKLGGYETILARTRCRDSDAAYLGDDIPDLGPLGRCGWPAAVANASPAVKRAAQYVTRRRGGEGAVAEVIELLLRRAGRWPRNLLDMAQAGV